MNFLRNMVSGNRVRYKDSEYDLDLTYITPRLLAMSFPASGLESLYRNHIDSVASFLQKNHQKNYLIVNLSNRPYDYSKFHNQVVDFPWEDHHSPELTVLF